MSALKSLFVPSLWMILLFLWPNVSSGQITTATISVRISDASGSPVPQCTVIATNEATGITHTATTTEDGQYLLPLLPIAGSYSIEAERKDFQRFVQRNIALRVNENVVSSGANFGRITSAGDPRLIQFGLKYMF